MISQGEDVLRGRRHQGLGFTHRQVGPACRVPLLPRTHELEWVKRRRRWRLPMQAAPSSELSTPGCSRGRAPSPRGHTGSRVARGRAQPWSWRTESSGVPPSPPRPAMDGFCTGNGFGGLEEVSKGQGGMAGAHNCHNFAGGRR